MLSSNIANGQAIASSYPDKFVDQREKYLNYKSENMSISPLGVLRPRKLLFEDLFPIKIAPRNPLKRKLELINNADQVGKKHKDSIGNIIASLDECKAQSLSIDISASKPVFPLLRRKARIGTQLFSADSPSIQMVSSPADIVQPFQVASSNKQPKYFTFSEDHIALSSQGQLRIKKT